jgi:flavodoxin
MNILIICVSKEHGNTQKIAESMTKALDATMLKPDEVDPSSLEQYDLIGYGSGIRWAKHYRELLEFITKMPHLEGRRAFVFSTSGFGIKWPQHNALRKGLKDKGLSVIGEYCCK